jgi:MOSC domain-containing protein YiiM
MKVISLNIGEKTTINWRGRSFETGIFKFPVERSLYLGEEDVANDNVIDRRVHGGINQAVYGYSIEHYSYFKELYPNLNWQYGMFGENLTFSELNEEKINVGDIFQLGETTIEASKPRRPCFKLGIRFKDQSVIKQFMETTKSGIYFKVLKTGFVKLNDRLILIEKSKDIRSIASVFLSKK